MNSSRGLFFIGRRGGARKAFKSAGKVDGVVESAGLSYLRDRHISAVYFKQLLRLFYSELGQKLGGGKARSPFEFGPYIVFGVPAFYEQWGQLEPRVGKALAYFADDIGYCTGYLLIQLYALKNKMSVGNGK